MQGYVYKETNCRLKQQYSVPEKFLNKQPDLLIDNLRAITAWKASAFGAILVRIFENTDQNNSEYGYFLRSAYNKNRRNSCSAYPSQKISSSSIHAH